MRRLFKFPPIADTYVFVERALKIQDTNFRAAPIVQAAQVHPPPQASPHKIPNPNRASYMSPQYNAQIQERKSNTLNRLSSVATSVVKPLVMEEENPLMEEVQYLRNIQLHQAARLERLIYSMQTDVLQ
jgi:hypothetical protein